MYTRRFFILSLLMPLLLLVFVVLVAAIATKHAPGHLGAILAPYITFFLFFLFWSSRNKPKAIRDAAYRAPLIFLLFQCGYLVLEFSRGVSVAKDVVGLGGILVILTTYGSLIGYLYVFVMEQCYFSYLYYLRHHPEQRLKKRKTSKVMQ